MGDDLMHAVAELVEYLVVRATEDDRLRAKLHELARSVAAATAPPPPARLARVLTQNQAASASGADPVAAPIPTGGVAVRPVLTLVLPPELSTAPGSGPDLAPGPITEREPPQPAEPLRELTFGRGRPSGPESIPPPGGLVRAADPHADLPASEARCRLKARGVRWASARVRLRDAGVDIADGDRAILDEGRRLGVFLWMNTPSFEVPRDPAVGEELADAFEMLAEALSLAQSVLFDSEVHRDLLRPALDLVAEAQSALRVAVDRVGMEEDHDQSAAFRWLRGMTEREGIFVGRHMRLADPADPAEAPRLRLRIDEQMGQVQAARGRSKKRRGLLGKLQWHAGRLDRRNPDDENWPRIVATVDALVTEEGMPPSSVELREVLLPLHDDLPDRGDDPAGFRLALREVDDYLATREGPPEDSTPEIPIVEVAEVAGWLRGRSIVLIGGSRRPGSGGQIQAAFGLKELVWISTREHESIDKFEPVVARPEVALVLLAIRWSSHSFGEVKRFCDRSGKPLVRLPGGYGVNQIAAQIVAQSSHQLAQTDRTPLQGASE